MIFDKIQNISSYPFGEYWQMAFSFMYTISPESKCGEYQILDERIFARILEYPTMEPDQLILESHKKYIDIQTTLVGSERIKWFAADELEKLSDYDEKKDLQKYVYRNDSDLTVDMFPGTFSMFFPEDAHMPGISSDGCGLTVKKMVVKIDVEFLRQK